MEMRVRPEREFLHAPLLTLAPARVYASLLPIGPVAQ